MNSTASYQCSDADPFSAGEKFTGEGSATAVKLKFTLFERCFQERLLREQILYVMDDLTLFGPGRMPVTEADLIEGLSVEAFPALNQDDLITVPVLQPNASPEERMNHVNMTLAVVAHNDKKNEQVRLAKERWYARELKCKEDIGKAYGILTSGIAYHCAARVYIDSIAAKCSSGTMYERLREVWDGLRQRFAVGQSAGRDAMIEELKSLTDEGGWALRYKGWTAITQALSEIGHSPSDADLMDWFAEGTKNEILQNTYIVNYRAQRIVWVPGKPPLPKWNEMALLMDKFLNTYPKYDTKPVLANAARTIPPVLRQEEETLRKIVCYTCGRDGHYSGQCTEATCTDCGFKFQNDAARDAHIGFWKPESKRGCPRRINPGKKSHKKGDHVAKEQRATPQPATNGGVASSTGGGHKRGHPDGGGRGHKKPRVDHTAQIAALSAQIASQEERARTQDLVIAEFLRNKSSA
jgi:hypothetical protein